MKRFLVGVIICALVAIAWAWVWPLQQADTKPLVTKADSKSVAARFNEPELKQLEDARFYLDTKSLAFGQPPSVPSPSPTSVTSQQKEVANGLTKEVPPKEDIAGKNTETKAVERPTFGWRLAGIIVSETKRSALFVSSSGTKMVTRGALLDGWRLVLIAPNQVNLQNRGFSRTLVLFNEGNVPEGALPRGEASVTGVGGVEPQTNAPQSMQDFGPVRREPAWTGSSVQGGPVEFVRKKANNPNGGETGSTPAESPKN